MNRSYHHCYATYAIVVALVATISVSVSAQDTVTVKWVANATTFTTTSGETIALLGISIPKKQAYTGKDCRDVLKNLIQGKTVVLVKDSIAKKNAYYVFLNDELINLSMLKQGAAIAAHDKHSRSSEFKAAYNQAQYEKVGNWHDIEKLKEAVQCEGITQKNKPCKRKTRNPSKKCDDHK